MKAHLLDSDIPLVAGKDCVALCEKVVEKVQFPFFWDRGVFGLPQIDPLKCCSKCWRTLEGKSEPGSLIYALISGAELRAGDLEGQNAEN